MSRGCVFCAIGAGHLPASVVYRDALCIGLMDIHPLSAGHVLVVPLRHAPRLNQLPPEERAHLLQVASRVLAAQQALGLARDGANLLLNDGSAANQHVPHVHLHLIPRVSGDRLKMLLRFVARMFDVFGRRARRARLDAQAAQLAALLASG